MHERKQGFMNKKLGLSTPPFTAYWENFANLSTKYGVRLKRITASL